MKIGFSKIFLWMRVKSFSTNFSYYTHIQSLIILATLFSRDWRTPRVGLTKMFPLLLFPEHYLCYRTVKLSQHNQLLIIWFNF